MDDVYEDLYLLNVNNSHFVAMIQDGYNQDCNILGSKITISEKKLVNNLRLVNTDCGSLYIYKYKKNSGYDQMQCIMEHHLGETPGSPPDNMEDPESEDHTFSTYVLKYCQTKDGSSIELLFQQLFNAEQFIKCICFSIEQTSMHLAETLDYYWVFLLDI